MKEIAGVTINELEDLETNLQRLRQTLNKRLNFWTTYEGIIASYKQKRGIDRVGNFFKAMLFFGVFPNYIKYQFQGGQRRALIAEAEEDLVAYYNLPETKVRRFKLQCVDEKNQYAQKIQLIDEEISAQEANLVNSSIGQELKQQIEEVLQGYADSRRKYEGKHAFYSQCEERLTAIEEQVRVYHSLQASKLRLEALEEEPTNEQKQTDTQEELQLFEYYGQLLGELSENLNKVQADTEEKMEELELQEILSKVKVLA